MEQPCPLRESRVQFTPLPQGQIKQINSTQDIRAWEPCYESYVGWGNIEAAGYRFGPRWEGMFTLKLRPPL